MHEKNKDGHKTGFITRDLNYGQHYQDYLEHQRTRLIEFRTIKEME